MTHNTFTFNIYKTDFHGQYWHSENTKAVIVLAHGMGEHANRYTNFIIPSFVKNNYALVAFDHFGHGKTSGKRGHNPSFEAVLESVEKTIEKAKNVFPNTPVFLYGHSMGGNVVLNYILRKEHSLQGIIATSPFLKLAFEPPAWKLTMGKILQKIAPAVTMGNELNPNHISRDKKEVDKYSNDPLIHDRISANFSLTFIDTGKWAIENAHILKTPVFLAHGTDDKIIDYRGTATFAKNNELATLKLYEGGYHELHNDFCKEELFSDILDWLKSRL